MNAHLGAELTFSQTLIFTFKKKILTLIKDIDIFFIALYFWFFYKIANNKSMDSLII